MKNGLRVYDSDTHVGPTAEVLDKYVDSSFRERLGEIAQYLKPGGGPGRHNYRFGEISFKRILGEAAPRESKTGRELTWMGSKQPRPGVQDDQPDARIQDMDDEGADADFLVPSSWLSLVGHEDPTIEVNLARAYHRYMADFSSKYPERLKSLIVASARDVEAGVAEIRQWGKSHWAVAVMPLVTKDVPVDQPRLEPILKAAVEHDLPIVHHSFTWTPPYFPGVFDLWDNVFLGRLAAHPWGAMRFAAAVIGGGLMDRFPTMRVGTLECGFGWLPFWGKRMDEQYTYVNATPTLKMKPSEYLSSGRFFCSVERHEGPEMFDMVTRFLGDGVLMYASDYPHSECQFPETVKNFLAWDMPPETRKKLMSGNADRFFKQA